MTSVVCKLEVCIFNALFYCTKKEIEIKPLMRIAESTTLVKYDGICQNFRTG